MNPKKNNNTGTNKAWEKLYSRLEEDGLLPVQTNVKKHSLKSLLRYAAVFSLVLASVFIITLLKNMLEPTEKIITLINTEKDMNLVTILEDGSIVYLKEKAALSYPKQFEKEERKVILEGEAFFDVQKQPDKPFFIETRSAKVEVLGTSFKIKEEDKQSFSLSVEEGHVKVTFKSTGQEVYINKGESIISDAGKLVKTSGKETGLQKEYKDHIHFKDESLENIIHVINKNSGNMQLEIHPDLKDRLLTVTFEGSSQDTMVQLICKALDLQYEKEGNIIRIIKLN